MYMKYFFSFFFFISVSAIAQQKLTLRLSGGDGSGTYQIAFYTQESTFLSFDGVFKSTSTKTDAIVVEDLPKGEYAIAVFYDENNNGELDTNWIGIPKEPLGFSIGKMKTFGPPSFTDCTFIVPETTELFIQVK